MNMKNLGDEGNKLKKEQMKKTWKPVAAGIMVIIFCGLVGIALMGVMGFMSEGSIALLEVILYVVIPLAMVGLAFVGGIYSMERSKWKLALAGSISAFFLVVPSFLFVTWVKGNSGYLTPFIVFGVLLLLIGIAPVVLIALSKSEFK